MNDEPITRRTRDPISGVVNEYQLTEEQAKVWDAGGPMSYWEPEVLEPAIDPDGTLIVRIDLRS